MNEEYEDWPTPTPGPDLDKLKVKTACCPACGGWVFVSAFPQSETSKDSQKEFRACIKAGLTIDVVTLREAHGLTYCPTRGECATQPAPVDAPLFTLETI